MQGYSYTFIETKKESNLKANKKIIRKIQQFYEKIKMRRLYKKLPIEKEGTEFLGVKGERITLPFTEEQLYELGNRKCTELINRIIIREAVQNIVVENGLEPYLDEKVRIDGGIIPFVYIQEMLLYVRRKYRIAKREQKLVLIDSGGKDTEAVLKQIYENLNYLTVLTKREERFLKIRNIVYEESGLMIGISPFSLEEKPEADIIIDLSGDDIENYSFFPKGSVVLDLNPVKAALKRSLAEHQGYDYYNSLLLTDAKNGMALELSLLQAVIAGEPTWKAKADLEHLYQNRTEVKSKIRVEALYTRLE